MVQKTHQDGNMETMEACKHAKLANLIKLGSPKSKAWEWANTSKGYWHVRIASLLYRTITNDTTIGMYLTCSCQTIT